MEYKEMSKRTLLIGFAGTMAATILSGCTTMQDLHQNLVRNLREPGEIMVVNPEQTELFHECPGGRYDSPELLETDTLPERVKPGEEVNHRLKYVLCLEDHSAVLKGEIIRSVSFEGKMVFRDSTKYSFKPGVWTVDAFLAVPPDAPDGIYKVETVIAYDGKTMKRNHTFQVKRKQEEK
jgi:hypothetical protein